MGDDEDTNNAPRSRGDNNAAASDIGPAMVREISCWKGMRFSHHFL